MIVQHAMLRIRQGVSDGFEAALRDAIPLIAVSPGFRAIEVRPACETVGYYLLRVLWDDIGCHRSFQKSDRYGQVRELLGPFYEPWPDVSYFGDPVIHFDQAAAGS